MPFDCSGINYGWTLSLFAFVLGSMIHVMEKVSFDLSHLVAVKSIFPTGCISFSVYSFLQDVFELGCFSILKALKNLMTMTMLGLLSKCRHTIKLYLTQTGVFQGIKYGV